VFNDLKSLEKWVIMREAVEVGKDFCGEEVNKFETALRARGK